MCGIVAIFSRGEAVVERAAVRAATAVLQHRGPDEQNSWLAEDGRIGLGHALLNIVSPRSAQPIANERGDLQLAVNGEFYDHRPIRRELERRGHHFATDSDSEIALHLYEEAGIEGCLTRLRGEFAFLLWDGSRQILYAVRDRFGIKPLFYGQKGDLVYLASEAKALFAAGFPAAWDKEAALSQLLGCLYADRSLFEGVYQVPPGHYLQISAGQMRPVCYWDVNYPRRRALRRPDHPDDYLPQVRALLTEAVKLRAEAHAPVGCLLSGGVDSAAVLALAAAHSDKPTAAFTIAFQTEGYNEIEKARTAANHIGAYLHEIPVDDEDLADCFAAAAYHAETIQVNAHGTARFILSREIQKAGYRAVMAGEGADELFLGYGFVRAAVQASGGQNWLRLLGRLPGLLRPLTPAEQQMAAFSPWLPRLSRLIAFPPALVDNFARGLGLMYGVLSAEAKERMARHDVYRAFATSFDWRGQLLGRASAHQILYFWLRSVFVTYHMAADRLDMAHAVEVRFPFLDHCLFEAVSGIHPAVLGHDHTQKYLLRQAASPWLPESIWRGAKQPFYAPPITRRPDSGLLTLAQDTLRGPSLAALPFFDQPGLVALLDRLPDLPPLERAVMDPLLLMATSLCLVQQAYRL